MEELKDIIRDLPKRIHYYWERNKDELIDEVGDSVDNVISDIHGDIVYMFFSDEGLDENLELHHH